MDFLTGGIISLKLKKQLNLEIPHSTRQVADGYIIGKVGETYFKNNFVFNKEESAKDADNPSYNVQYDFLPLKQYSSNDVVEVNVSNTIATEPAYGNKIPDCVSDSSLCKFTLSQEKLNGLIAQYKVVTGNIELQPPYLKAYICPENKVFLVDYRTKAVTVDNNTNFNKGPVFISPCVNPVIEEEGILKVKATPEYKALLEKYGEEKVTVKAIEKEELTSVKFLKQIDPLFADISGCIIVVEAPNGEGYVYQQDEQFNTIHRITLAQFIEGSKGVDQATMNMFYSELK